jgi:hypothetical protein
MKKVFKKSSHPIWSLVIWFAMAVCVFTLIYSGIIGATRGSVFIMVTFFLWPCFLISKSLINQILFWFSSQNEDLREKLEPLWTINDRFNSSKRIENPLFWRILYTTIFIFWLTIALVAFFCSPWSRSMVYGFAHSVYIFVTHMFSTGWTKATVWIWLLVTVVFIVVTVWFFRCFKATITREELIKRAIIYGICFLVHRVLSYWLLSYTSSMIVSSIVFWIVFAIFTMLFCKYIGPHILNVLEPIFIKHQKEN